MYASDTFYDATAPSPGGLAHPVVHRCNGIHCTWFHSSCALLQVCGMHPVGLVLSSLPPGERSVLLAHHRHHPWCCSCTQGLAAVLLRVLPTHSSLLLMLMLGTELCPLPVFVHVLPESAAAHCRLLSQQGPNHTCSALHASSRSRARSSWAAGPQGRTTHSSQQLWLEINTGTGPALCWPVLEKLLLTLLIKWRRQLLLLVLRVLCCSCCCSC